MHSLVLDHLVDIVNHIRRCIFVPADEDRHIGYAVQMIGVAHESHRSGIHDDIVIPFAQFGEQLFHAVRLQQLRRIGRNSAARDQVEVLMLAARHDDILYRCFRFRQIIRQVSFVS